MKIEVHENSLKFFEFNTVCAHSRQLMPYLTTTNS